LKIEKKIISHFKLHPRTGDHIGIKEVDHIKDSDNDNPHAEPTLIQIFTSELMVFSCRSLYIS